MSLCSVEFPLAKVQRIDSDFFDATTPGHEEVMKEY
jgi:hypothetical protein